mmetsp:Transcript_45098/g.111821  ORF Transcript_45098/g.111821 Transcript_45098/m.111821 type:complete len:272 (+) Transcript_45098:101-916(+)
MPANAAMHCARDPWRHRPHTRRAAEPSAAYLRKSALCAVCDGAEPPMPLITGSKLKWRIWRGLRSAPGVSLSVRTSSISVSRAGEERAAADCGRFAGSARGRCWATRPVPSASASSPMCASQGELKIIFSSPCLSSAVAPVVAVGRWVRRGGAVLERLRPLGSGAWASAAACSPLTLLCRLRLVSLDGDSASCSAADKVARGGALIGRACGCSSASLSPTRPLRSSSCASVKAARISRWRAPGMSFLPIAGVARSRACLCAPRVESARRSC